MLQRILAQSIHVTPILVLVGLLWFVVFMVPCGPQQLAKGGEDRGMPKKSIEAVLREHTNSLMAIPGVVGAGQGLCTGEPCIRVFVAEKTDEIVKQIPSEIDGYPVEIKETGEFRKLEPG